MGEYNLNSQLTEFSEINCENSGSELESVCIENLQLNVAFMC